jgi:RimJ/RimL family protein N-acetyltransferase
VHVVAETERLLLRRFTADDVDLLVELDSDPEVMFFVTGGRPTPRAEIEHEHIPGYLAYHESGDIHGFWVVVDRASGAGLGWVHVRPPLDGSTPDPELGYRLRRSAWGRGLATEASRAMVDRTFATGGAERIFAHTMAVNTASRRVLEKVGLRYVRTFVADWPDRIPGDEHGDVEYALTRTEWEQARASRPPFA